MGGVFWTMVAGGAAALLGYMARRRLPFAAAWRRSRFAARCREFHWQREHLEARFLCIGQLNARPGSPRWIDCDFSDDVSYVRNRYTGELSAFVAVRIRLALPSSKQNNEPQPFEHQTQRGEQWRRGMGAEEMIREATAVFRFAGDRWETDGRAIFNLSPSETIRFYQNDLEKVGEELASQR